MIADHQCYPHHMWAHEKERRKHKERDPGQERVCGVNIPVIWQVVQQNKVCLQIVDKDNTVTIISLNLSSDFPLAFAELFSYKKIKTKKMD